MSDHLRSKARRLLELHAGPPILVLPNVWDVASARIVAATRGCEAIATSSAGVAAALGYPDGEAIPREKMLTAVERIAAAVALPVTADLEAGYGESADAAAATAEGALAAGAVGLNLEDGRDERDLVDASLHVARIRAARAVGEAAGVHLVLNARTDAYLIGSGDLDGRFRTTVERARLYRSAGADSIFVPGVSDADTIGRLAEAIDAPLNVLAVAGTPPVSELEGLGVARVSVGSGPMRAAAALTAAIAEELLERGTYSLLERAMPYRELNDLLAHD